MTTNISAHIRVAARKAEFSQMICEAQRQIHVRSLGGSRAWFLCPACNRRCAILYPVKCRLCLGLNYASEHEGKLDRLLRKAIKHRTKYGQTSGGICLLFPSKPKRMRWHTYFRARKQAQTYEAQVLSKF